MVFHYFPHNVRSLTFYEAEHCVKEIITTMDHMVSTLKLGSISSKARDFNYEEFKEFHEDINDDLGL